MRFTRSEKAVLNAVIASPPDLQGRWYTTGYVYALVRSKVDLRGFRTAVSTLYNRKALTWGDTQQTAFELTDIGLNYKECDHLESKEKWKERFWSFLLGFISAALLELFVLWITGLLG